MKLPFVKEALHEVTFTFILSPIPEDYTSVFVPVTSKTTPCCIYSFIKSVFINYLCHECTKITRLLLCLFFFSLCALKQPFFFCFCQRTSSCRTDGPLVFASRVFLQLKRGKNESERKRREKTATGSSCDGRAPPCSTQQQHCYLRPT